MLIILALSLMALGLLLGALGYFSASGTATEEEANMLPYVGTFLLVQVIINAYYLLQEVGVI